MLPVFPALALLVGATISEPFDQGKDPLLKSSFATVALLCVAGLGIILYPHLATNSKISAAGALMTGTVLLGGGLLSLVFLLKGRRESFFALLCLTACLSGVIAPPVLFARSVETKSTRELAWIVRDRYPDVPLVSYGHYRQDLPFYSGKRVIIAGSSGELEFGRQQAKEPGWFIGPATFFSLWDSPRQVLTIIGRNDLVMFQRVVKTPVRIIAERGETLLITNQ
ncbi:MAG: hypothetical protein E4H15_03210 [Syntrophobacterales bacterium]|nr:MAG: hypothetical protein E4H15_03210 [Syntrophobacterales bacterium]